MEVENRIITMEDIEFIHIDEIFNAWASCDSSCIYVDNTKPLTNIQWQKLLARKRSHKRYAKVLKFIKDHGFNMPLSYLYASDDVKVHCDGHHRLAAAIELGYVYIPYLQPYNKPHFRLKQQDFASLDLSNKTMCYNKSCAENWAAKPRHR
jgi:hypothetical protein